MEEEIIKSGMEEMKSVAEIFGDDGGAFRFGGKWIVLTNDMLVESSDVLKEMSPEDAGFKCVTMNVSDLVAMGSEPMYFGFSIGLPEENLRNVKKYFRGIAEALRLYGMRLISADTNSARELVIDGIALGMADRLLLRKNARSGQVVCVTGDLGKCFSALLVSLRGFDADEGVRKALFEKILRPRARADLVGELVRISECAIDISDGLVKELKEISEASRCGIVIYPEKIPVSGEVLEFCSVNSLNPIDIAMNSGEEYEIIFTADMNDLESAEFDFTIIGEVVEGSGVWIRDRSGLREAEDRSWKHFSQNSAV